MRSGMCSLAWLSSSPSVPSSSIEICRGARVWKLTSAMEASSNQQIYNRTTAATREIKKNQKGQRSHSQVAEISIMMMSSRRVGRTTNNLWCTGNYQIDLILVTSQVQWGNWAIRKQIRQQSHSFLLLVSSVNKPCKAALNYNRWIWISRCNLQT